ncbi:NAD(P)-dependent oxidoreductase [Alphaproteobacteria bacterium]|jgi:3-hydroxyisobutyrate dehydrogenase|nr:NAD(P)-dependent oxidoreductase [Alphaproteobacteria bacterium]MDA9807173.1 NAD(P)-dependent oxidoreductase [Alphaproteobacteria bacterium]MDB2583466.1 NAD(P)-dependent oxidoreductase [Alphaproteobacteria bacterium]MDC1035286.1 NAD(P)-dependent oxidoreductase [Alphaproteobacteria bacterium]MDC3409896.1 NAD(P)-dependent oxidoreductase [Alphaproteobacteria bacterium]
MEKIGFIGLGNMGKPLAERLLKKYQLYVYDLDTKNLKYFLDKGAVACSNPSDLARNTSRIFLCLPTSIVVEKVIYGENGLLETASKGSFIIDMTTGEPEISRKISKALQSKEINFIDAPVSGGPKGANQGNIAIMVGGTKTQFSTIKPIMDDISSNIFYAGEVGSGHSIKAGNNLLNLICRMATFEVISMLVKDGVSPETAVNIIQKSSGRNYATEITLPDNIISGKMFQGFSTGLMKKDAGVATKIAISNKVEIPLGKLSQELLKNTIDEFGENADMSNVALTYEKLTGAKIRP